MRRWAIPCVLLLSTLITYSAGATKPRQRTIQAGAAARLALGAHKLPSTRVARLLGDRCRVTPEEILKQLRDGQGETICWPNGRELTNSAGTVGVEWHHSNGTMMTAHGWVGGLTGYYWNGHPMTRALGKVGAAWYHDNGQVMCKQAGVAGADWYDRKGNLVTSDGPAWTDDETLDQCYLRLIESSLAH